MKNNINRTLRTDLCTGCGVCEGACPFDAISTVVEKGNFRPEVDNAKCTNCGRCIKACPGLGVDFTRISESCQSDASHYDKMVGYYEKCFTGFSSDNNVRYHSASGGMVSQFLIWLIETNKIDGAVVTRFDKGNPLLVETFIATTRDDIISARSSKYSPVTLNKMPQAIKAASGSRYVIVGLPCHIEGVRKLIRIDKELRDKVVGLFGLYCSSGRSFNLTEYVFKERGIELPEISYFQYRDEGCLGKMVVKMSQSNIDKIYPLGNYSEKVIEDNEAVYKEPYQSYFHPLRSFFIPNRCNYCIDHYAELADICFGDIHIKPYSDDTVGINSIIVKNMKWLTLLEECRDAGAIHLEEIPFKTISDSQRMSFKKKGRNGAFVNIARKIGLTVPEYDVDYLRKPTRHDWISFIETRLQQYIGNHKSLWGVIGRMKSKVNIH
jgi:coenzyme F420 hydrogenase subunit beta